jgi:hypothetical protein
MLKKSKKSAFAMAYIFILSGIITRTIFEIVFGFGTGLYSLFLKYTVEGTFYILSFAVLVLFLPIAAWILSLFICGRDDNHFGIKGIYRWSMAGVIYGLFKVGITLLVDVNSLDGFWKVVEDILGFLAIVVSYFVVFKGLLLLESDKPIDLDG